MILATLMTKTFLQAAARKSTFNQTKILVTLMTKTFLQATPRKSQRRPGRILLGRSFAENPGKLQDLRLIRNFVLRIEGSRRKKVKG